MGIELRLKHCYPFPGKPQYRDIDGEKTDLRKVEPWKSEDRGPTKNLIFAKFSSLPLNFELPKFHFSI